MKKYVLFIFLIIALLVGQAAAENNITIMMDSISNSLDSVDIPF